MSFGSVMMCRGVFLVLATISATSVRLSEKTRKKDVDRRVSLRSDNLQVGQ